MCSLHPSLLFLFTSSSREDASKGAALRHCGFSGHSRKSLCIPLVVTSKCPCQKTAVELESSVHCTWIKSLRSLLHSAMPFSSRGKPFKSMEVD